MTQDTLPLEPAAASTFAALGLGPELAAAVLGLGYEEATPIQREAIPVLLSGRDLLGQAATGTGKTAAFALPLIQVTSGQKLNAGKPRALVLVPTRELAMQVAEAVHRYGKALGASVLPVYGGTSFGQQVRVLSRGVQVVVATPGRAVDHLTRGTMDLSEASFVVLDEADEMLDMGFAEDLEAILSRAPKPRQTALFSATMAPHIMGLAKNHLTDPVQVSIARERAEPGAVPRVRQTAYLVRRDHKIEALGRVLDMESPTSVIVFCRTRVAVDEVTESMNARGYRSEALHGGFSQDQRERVLGRFRDNRVDLLIATDVAARGLDIEHISHVVNFDVPIDPDAYVHRIGRTGRAGREGVAITFLEPREQRLLRNIQNATRAPIQMAQIPTAVDLDRRRRELTRAALLEVLEAKAGGAFQAMAAELAQSVDPVELAAAALELAHRAEHGGGASGNNDQDFAVEGSGQKDRRGPPQRDPRQQRDFRESRDSRESRDPRDSYDSRDRRPQSAGDFGDRRGDQGPGPDAARLFIGAGRFQSLRPGDLVGAITGETGLPSDVIGPIRIAERFSLIDVAAEHADDIIRALRKTKVRGLKMNVRYDREV